MALKILEVNLPSNFLRLTVYTSRLLQRRAGMVLVVLNLLIPDIIHIYIYYILYIYTLYHGNFLRNHETWNTCFKSLTLAGVHRCNGFMWCLGEAWAPLQFVP